MTSAQLLSRQITADRRARDLQPTARSLAADRWSVESARRDVTYIVRFSAEGARCSCVSGDQGMPCYHVSACFVAVSTITPESPTPGALAA